MCLIDVPEAPKPEAPQKPAPMITPADEHNSTAAARRAGRSSLRVDLDIPPIDNGLNI